MQLLDMSFKYQFLKNNYFKVQVASLLLFNSEV